MKILGVFEAKTKFSQVWEVRDRLDPSELPERDFSAPPRHRDPISSPFSEEDEP